jgi:hypothetical protein
MSTPQTPPSAAVARAITRLPPVTRREQLRLELLTTVDSLQRRRADLITAGFIEDYVALGLARMERRCPAPDRDRANMCEQMRARLN